MGKLTTARRVPLARIGVGQLVETSLGGVEIERLETEPLISVFDGNKLIAHLTPAELRFALRAYDEALQKRLHTGDTQH